MFFSFPKKELKNVGLFLFGFSQLQSPYHRLLFGVEKPTVASLCETWRRTYNGMRNNRKSKKKIIQKEVRRRKKPEKYLPHPRTSVADSRNEFLINRRRVNVIVASFFFLSHPRRRVEINEGLLTGQGREQYNINFHGVIKIRKHYFERMRSEVAESGTNFTSMVTCGWKGATAEKVGEGWKDTANRRKKDERKCRYISVCLWRGEGEGKKKGGNVNKWPQKRIREKLLNEFPEEPLLNRCAI